MEKLSLEKQPKRLPVINFDSLIQSHKEERRHGDLLPNTIRAIVCGPSNCGKTNALLALITDPNGLRFENVYVFSKSLHQPKYKLLQKVLEPVEGINYFAFGDHEQVVPPEKAKPNSLMVFDDVACDRQDHIRSYFCMGRHQLVDCFYLCQTYTRIPKHLIRDNANLILIFSQDDLNLRYVYRDHVNMDMTYPQFKDMCMSCWPNHGFLVIDKDSEPGSGRYRKGFDTFIVPNFDSA